MVKVVEPILKALAVPGGYTHVGKPGAGHFAKLVHNGIEFDMLQAIGEGFALLRKSEYEIDIGALFHTWAYGSSPGGCTQMIPSQARLYPSLRATPSRVVYQFEMLEQR